MADKPSTFTPLRTPIDQVGVQGALKYGNGGAMPADARRVVQSVHATGDAVQYVSDTPYVPSEVAYNDRPVCAGITRKGAPCGAKSAPGERFCPPHADQE